VQYASWGIKQSAASLDPDDPQDYAFVGDSNVVIIRNQQTDVQIDTANVRKGKLPIDGGA
jgi:uncharacterized membrane protein